MHHVLIVDFRGFCHMFSGRGTYSQATPRLLSSCDKQPTVSTEKFDYCFPYLVGLEDQFSASEDAVVHLDTFMPYKYLGVILASNLAWSRHIQRL